MRQSFLFFLSSFVIFFYGCDTPSDNSETTVSAKPKGTLVIIGGGKRPAEMVEEMINLAGVAEDGYIAVLPMSSSEPDTSFYYAKKQFTDRGVQYVVNFHIEKGARISTTRLDSLKGAKLIYISGGEQTRFMNSVAGTQLLDVLHSAYRQGAVIAGTSAGAAVMSKKMITGNEFKHPTYTGDFQTIESDNMELLEGIGFLQNTIIDQHFIRRMRMNRLITVAIENPGYTCIGIDESTALIVRGDSARVFGESQVIILKNNQMEYTVREGLLGSDEIDLRVYVPGDTFFLNDTRLK